MRDLCHDAARRGRVDPFDRLIELGDTEALDDRLLFFRVADHAPVILDLDLAAAVCFYFLCHNSSLRVRDLSRSYGLKPALLT